MCYEVLLLPNGPNESSLLFYLQPLCLSSCVFHPFCPQCMISGSFVATSIILARVCFMKMKFVTKHAAPLLISTPTNILFRPLIIMYFFPHLLNISSNPPPTSKHGLPITNPTSCQSCTTTESTSNCPYYLLLCSILTQLQSVLPSLKGHSAHYRAILLDSIYVVPLKLI